MRLIYMILFLLSGFTSIVAQAKFEVTYYPGNFSQITYETELVKLALDRTRSTYGDYQLSPASEMPFKRRINVLKQNSLPNFVLVNGHGEQLLNDKNITYISFPFDLGALGWRICFVSPQSKEKVKAAKSLDDLRKFSILQGTGWYDNVILRENGFDVIESDYSSLFKMIAIGRADLFCRGINELPGEYKIFKKNIGNLTYDESFAFVYKMPLFLYIHSANALAKRRIEEGLKIAYADGSIMRLWLATNSESVELSRIKKRKFYYLKNSSTDKLSKEYEKYLIDPLTLK